MRQTIGNILSNRGLVSEHDVFEAIPLLFLDARFLGLIVGKHHGNLTREVLAALAHMHGYHRHFGRHVYTRYYVHKGVLRSFP